VLDANTTESGSLFFVMELVKGVPITKYCDEHRLTPKERLELFVPVCKAVQHAHQKGIIHRDLKPSNILVALYDGKPVPKMIDFGVAKATGQKLTDKTLFTDFGAVVGTLEYMSPEQAELNQLDIDTRSDIYSLGVLLYELLTGTTPLERKRVHRAAILEVLRLIREEEPQRPSLRLSTTDELPSVAANRGLEPKKLSGLVRGDLDWIVMKCLEKDRNRRYKTANGLAADVQRYLTDEPVLASPPSAAYRLRKFARRNKTSLRTTVAVLVVLLLAASGLGWALWDRAAQDEARRIDHTQRMGETDRAVSVALARAEQLADQARKQPSVSSAEAAAVLVIWQQADDALGQAEAALSTRTADDALRQRVTALRAQLQEGRQQTERGRMQALRKEKLFRDLDEAQMASAMWVDNHFDLAGAAAKYAAALVAYDLEVVAGANDELARRISAAEPEVRDALIVALDAWAALGDWAGAAELAQRAWLTKDLRALAQAADKDAWRKRYRVAVTAKDGVALHDLSAEARRSSLPPSSLILLAGSLNLLGENDEALAVLRFGRGRHPTDFWLHFELGAFLWVKKGRTPVEVEEAIGCYRAALALRPASSAVHNNLGSVLFAKKQLDEAIAEYKKAIDFEPKLARAHYNLGTALMAKNQLDEAVAEYKKAIDLQPDYAAAHCNLGSALRSQGQLAASLDFYKRGHALGSKLTDWRYPSAQWVAGAQRLVLLEAKLLDVLAGKATPADNRERLGLLEVCRLQRRRAAAAWLYADAFSADSKLADDLKAAHRYNAACNATLAAAGRGTDADKLDDKERGQLRKQALEWLRADLTLWSKLLEDGVAADRQATQKMLQHWQTDTDLAGVRDGAALQKLPAEEQDAWRQLWADVAQLLKKADNVK
jgi:tetratricopeptide (TPR) repeat protein